MAEGDGGLCHAYGHHWSRKVGGEFCCQHAVDHAHGVGLYGKVAAKDAADEKERSLRVPAAREAAQGMERQVASVHRHAKFASGKFDRGGSGSCFGCHETTSEVGR
jgi:hypothetical protein